jgi:hypothetical protein
MKEKEEEGRRKKGKKEPPHLSPLHFGERKKINLSALSLFHRKV